MAVVLLWVLPAMGQFSAAPVITSAGPYEVDEGATSIATLTATDSDTAEADLVWSLAGDADGAAADTDAFTLSESGVLAFGSAKDYELPDDADADGIYELTVRVSDDDANEELADIDLILGNVIEITAITGPETVAFAENGWSRVATFTASSDADRDGVMWVLGGDDATLFSIDSPSGALRFALDKVMPSVFSKPPDYEAPVDTDTDNAYEVTVQPTTTSDTAAMAVAVAVAVTDADEDGTLALSTKRPRTGVTVTAALSDPDAVVDGSAAWEWERTAGNNRWVVIDGADSSSYTPVAADAGSFLRVSVTYSDRHTSTAQAQATAPEVVAADQLSALSISTNDSGTGDWRQMRPAFNTETLHYSVGCDAADTMTLTMSAADADTRIAVDGTQFANPGAGISFGATQEVTDDSVVRISLTDAEGAQTQYVVHCVPDDFGEITVTKPLGEGKVLDELFIYPNAGRLQIVDNNGVPRWHVKPDDRPSGAGGSLFFRFYPDVNGELRYSYSSQYGGFHRILDANRDEIDAVSAVAPLTRSDGHDFRVLDDGNYMLMAYQDAERDLSHLTFRDADEQPYGTQVYVEDSAIQIVTPSGVAVFNWNSWDHVPLEDCAQHFFPPGDGDYAHLNAIQMADGHIIASLRGCSRVLAIDATTGDVVWRVGPSNLSDAEWAERDIGPAPLDIIGDPEGHFCGEHGTSLLPNGNLLIYDNGVQCPIDPWTREKLLRDDYRYSRALEYAIDLDNGEAVYVREHSLHGTEDEVGYRGGNLEQLRNGHWLVSWGAPRGRNAVTEKPSDTFTQVDPDTGQEWLSVHGLPNTTRGAIMPPEFLAEDLPPLEARFPVSSYSSVFHSGFGDAPTAVLAFNRPVADFTGTSPSLSVQGASVTSVAPHVVDGEPANAYLVTLAPDGNGAITVSLATGESCDAGGICAADGTMLSVVPGARVINPPIEVSFGAAGYSVREGATLQVPVVLSAAHGRAQSVAVLIVGSAVSASGDDFSVAASVSFAAGETTKMVAFDAVDDALVEGPETARLGFGAFGAGFSAGSAAVATVTVTDTTDAAVFGFSVDSGEVSEGGETALTFVVTNGVTFAADQTIAITVVSGSATEGVDFVLVDSLGGILPSPYEVTLAAGSISVAVSLRAVDDSVSEVAETVTLSAALKSTGAPIGSRTVTIPASDRVLDAPKVTITGGGTVTEGADAVFSLTRTTPVGSPLTQPLTVRVQVTATGGVLGVAAPSTVTFLAGEGTVVLRLATVDDTVVEDEATVAARVLSSSANPPSYEPGTPNSATAAVRDDDMASLSVSPLTARVVEGDTATVTADTGGVTFAQPQTLTVTVDDGGSATLGDDFVLADAQGRELASPDELVLAAGAESATLQLRAAIDDVDDDAETVELSFGHNGVDVGTVTITLVEANERPTVSGPSRLWFEENTTTDVEMFTATDPESDSITWELDGADAAWFDIADGTLVFRAAPDFETPTDSGTDNVYEITVRASDPEGAADYPVTVTVTDFDEAADITSDSGLLVFSHAENATATVDAFTADDPEGAVIRWTLAGDDDDDFVISEHGVLAFARPPDFEHPADDDADNEYLVTVQARAGASEPVTAEVTVTVSDADEPGVVTLSSPQPQVDAALRADLSDPDDVRSVLSWTWQRSADGTSWTDITGAENATYTPAAADDLDNYLRAQAEYLDWFDSGTDRVSAQAAAAYATRAAPSTPNSAPDFGGSSLERTVAENSTAGTPIGAPVRAADPDAADRSKLAYTLSGDDAALFSIDVATGQIRVGLATVLDYEVPVRSYSVTVTAADPSGASGSVAVAVEVTDVNEAPVADPDIASTAEDAPVIVSVLANDTDPDPDTLTVEVRDAPLHGTVRVQADSTLLYRPASDFNGEDIFTYAASDGRLSDETIVIVTVSSVNDQPEFASRTVTRSVADGAEPKSAVGSPVTADDVDGEPLTYALFEPDAQFFTIDAHTGQIRVAPGTFIDRTVKSSYRLRVEATDPRGARVRTDVNVSVTARGASTQSTGGGSGGGGGGFEPSTAVVIVANGWSPSDIGAAAALSARTPDSAVIYTTGERLSNSARELLGDYLPASVIVVGGEAAVSDAAMAEMRLVSESDSVQRITGTTRTHTAASVARRILDAAEAGTATLIIANGWSPADIGTAAALSARTPRSAIAYTASGALPDATQRLLRDYRPARVLIVGGEAAVKPATESEIRAAAPAATVERVSGATRTATAAGMARRFLGPHQAAATGELTVIVANGWSPPDIGVAAALSARTAGSVVLYTEGQRLSAETAEVLRDYQPTRVVFIGGPAAITPEVKEQARAIVPDATAPRYSGSTRTQTAADVARRILGNP